MKFFRSHITQSIFSGILLAGIIFYFFKPGNVQAEEDAFTSWLQATLKTSNNTEVIDQIHQLSHVDVEIESVIRKASSLVRNHAEDFNLPVSPESDDENEVFHVLLKEWTAYQNSSTGMGNAVLIKQAQRYSVLPVDGISFSSKAVDGQALLITKAETVTVFQTPPVSSSFHISPLSGGTAIGAP
jgi:hypothetical protein